MSPDNRRGRGGIRWGVRRDEPWTPPDDLKERVNNLLFPVVPEQMTIGKFEEIAAGLYDLICDSVENYLSDK